MLSAYSDFFTTFVAQSRTVISIIYLRGSMRSLPTQLRSASGTKPICPEGPRYCGVPVWKMGRDEYQRLI